MLARTLALAVLLAARAPRAAEPPLAGGLPDVVGPRALGLSAAVGVAASNEGLFLNPAAVGVRKRYSVEAGAFVDRRGAENVAELFGGSIVDSMSSAVTGGVAYLRAREGAFTGNVWNVALSGPIANDVHLGVAGKYASGELGSESVRALTVDAGLFWQVAEYLSIGAAGYNLVPVDDAAVAPMGAGAGFALGTDRSFQITGDWRGDFDRAGKTTNRWAAGAELLVGQVLPLRAGFMKDETLGGSWWSAGVGLVSQGGVAIDVGYRQSLDDSNARALAATLKLFLFR